MLAVAYAAVVACSSRPSSWPTRTATPIQQGMVTPLTNQDVYGPICGPPCPISGGCPNMPVLFPCCPVGRCINIPFEDCAGSAAPHFCWYTIPQAADYTIVVEDMSPTARVVWAWTFHYANATPTIVGVEYGVTCGTPNPTAFPLNWGGPYQVPSTPTYNATTTPPPPTPLPPHFKWGVVARIDNTYFALGGPWEFVAAPP